HAARADADEHLHEIRAGDRKERHARFTSDRPCQQRLASSRRPDQQNAFRDTSAEFLELLRLTQELDNLFQFFLRFFDTGYVFERHLFLLRGVKTGAALAEDQSLV